MKKYALVFLSVFLFISAPFAAHANIVTATGKYIINAVKHVPGGAKVDAKNTVTGAQHVIKHGVSSADLGKGIGAGIVGMAVGSGLGLAFQAITGLALDAVDWVMDKENNQIKWKKKGDNGSGVGVGQYFWRTGVGGNAAFSSPVAACNGARLYFISVYGAHFIGTAVVNGNKCDIQFGSDPATRWINSYDISRFDNPAYDPSVSPDGYKSVPLVDLAKKVIEQADAGNAECQKTIEDYVTNLAKDGELDAELDASTDITKPEGTEPDPDKDKECPLGTIKVDDICVKPSDSDPPLFCNSGEFTRKVCDWMDWTQEKPTESVEKPIEVKEVKAENSNKIDMAGECPAPYELNFNVLGYAQNHSISYQPLCNALILLKPIFVGSGALSGMFILMGYSRASNTGVNG